ncbi:hypothetical protein Aspvir_000379 [Aspergillus viridinutans]|uniref:Uncharacterized protein n=1 Tax=Aspergillus viridinutans TaxID=75553 RepID=A0A9P3BL43_ASPVI|nr:uncharacterized protein Aspvir_000379 [Aspergillus viridinutans]GIJ98263.1 hypothetical protein Aspvir_000379 [Aspergillus viridinutans]
MSVELLQLTINALRVGWEYGLLTQPGFTHDPNVQPDSTTFKPERFLEAGGNIPELDHHILSFGFGRHVSPGKLLVDGILLIVAQSLAVFDFSKGVEDIQLESAR